MTAEPQPPPNRVQRLTANPALLLLLGIIALVALAAACIMGFMLLRPLIGGDGNGGTANDGTTAPGDPTPFPQGTAAQADQAIVVGVSESGTFSVTRCV